MIQHLLKCFLFSSFLFSLISNNIQAANFLPAPLLQLSSELSHHVLIAEKMSHTLYLYKNNHGFPQLVNTYTMVSGKISGDKVIQGDYKTPEGIFTLTRFIPHSKLIKMYGFKTGSIYGSGAFTLNYPNTMDLKRGKTGGGIWLHSTNDPSRLDKGLDSRGCLVIANDQLKEVSNFIELNKIPIIVTHRLNFLQREHYLQIRSEINNFITSWTTAWETLNLKNYLSHYSPKFHNRVRGNFKKFAAHKKYVFSLRAFPKIKLSDITILQSKNYTRISFIQDYSSRLIKDIGRKELYLTYNKENKLMIIDELWLKNGAPISTTPFTPHQQFFTPENQGSF